MSDKKKEATEIESKSNTRRAFLTGAAAAGVHASRSSSAQRDFLLLRSAPRGLGRGLEERSVPTLLACASALTHAPRPLAPPL